MEKHVTIVVADDNIFFRESLRVLLEHEPLLQIIAEAKNGEEAIAMARDICPDIILMDINMPVVNGFEATRKILKQNPSIKVIGLSLHKEESYCRNLFRLGAKGYVIKTTPYTEIIIAIKEVASGGKYLDKNITRTS